MKRICIVLALLAVMSVCAHAQSTPFCCVNPYDTYSYDRTFPNQYWTSNGVGASALCTGPWHGLIGIRVTTFGQCSTGSIVHMQGYSQPGEYSLVSDGYELDPGNPIWAQAEWAFSTNCDVQGALLTNYFDQYACTQ
jgi:hypothetical protein